MSTCVALTGRGGVSDVAHSARALPPRIRFLSFPRVNFLYRAFRSESDVKTSRTAALGFLSAPRAYRRRIYVQWTRARLFVAQYRARGSGHPANVSGLSLNHEGPPPRQPRCFAGKSAVRVLDELRRRLGERTIRHERTSSRSFRKDIFKIYRGGGGGEGTARCNFSLVPAINRKRPALIAKSALGAAVERRA